MENFDAIASAKKTIAVEVNGLVELGNIIDDNFTKAVEIMAGAKGRIIITGIGKSGHVGKKIAATMASTGTPTFFVHPAEASHGDLGMITNDDVVVALSKSGESKELSDIITYCKRYGITLIGIAQFADSTLIKQSDIPLMLPDMPEACPLGVAPTTSTTTTIAMGDALAMALLEKKQFSRDQFKDRHPGGKLGKSLIKVETLMTSGSGVPMTTLEHSVKEAIDEMSNKKKGCVAIVDDNKHVLAIITDGDIRRHLSNDFFDKTIKDVMTVGPVCIEQDTLAVEAAAIMNEKGITSLFVVENDALVGILHIHDCLRAGIL